MTSPSEESQLLSATNALAVKVAELSEHLRISQDQANRTERQGQRTKILTRWVAVLAVISLVGVVFTGIAVQTNKANAVTNCQNANESRKANKILWDFLIDASLAQDTQSPESRALLEDLKDFTTALYQTRDCADLGKKYPLPDPPEIPDLSPKS